VAGHRTGDTARATLSESDLDRGITIGVRSLDLGHAIVGHVDDRHRDSVAVVGE
jgi:hypothetical protein